MRYIFFIIVSVLAIVACKPVKKVQAIQTAITKKDTAQKIIIAETPKVDSAALVKEIMSKVMTRKINFTTFNSKIVVDYEGPEESHHVTAYVSIRKDSAIYIRITAAIVGVIEEVYVSRDSVVLISLKPKKPVEYRAISYLQDVIEMPFDFYALQDMIVGNPVFISSNVVSYKSSATQLQVFLAGNIFKHLLTLNNDDFRVLHSKLDDMDPQRNRTGDITFDDYEMVGGNLFATTRKISLAEKSKLDVTLVFKNPSFNDPLKYTFDIPKNPLRK